MKPKLRTSSPTIANENVGCWAVSSFRDKVKYHLEMSVKAWHDWNEDLPTQVEVICNEISKRYGKVLNVKRWLISPAQSGLKECLVAEIDIKQTSKFSSDAFVQIHINHLVPANG